MFVLSQSATGQYVITHPPTNTIMVGDDLVATYERIREAVGSVETLATKAAPEATPRRRAPWIVGIAIIALLPFLWLGALHVSLGRLVSELRAAPTTAEDSKELRARIERLERSEAPPDVRAPKPRKPEVKAATPPDEAKADAADEGDDD